jgi:hypothetical protein
MFFLTTYGMINLVAGLEELTRSPSYRPTIRVWWGISLAGAIGCFWVMSLINWLAALVAVVVEIAVYVGLKRRSLQASWGDLRYGALMSLVRSTFLRLRRLPMAARNWRPHILVFAGDLEKRLDLVRFAAWLNQGRGLLTVCHLAVGDAEELAEAAEERTRQMQELLDGQGITAFAEASVVPDFEHGVTTVSQAHGIAGIVSNTIMFGWSEKSGRVASTLRIMRAASRFGKSTVLCRISPPSWAPGPKRIDIWWGGLQNNGDLLLLLAHLVTLNDDWSSARINLKCVASESNPSRWSHNRLQELLEGSRITATPEVIDNPDQVAIKDIIHDTSRDADIVFVGLREPDPGTEEAYAEYLEELVSDLRTVILVRAAGPFTGQLLDSISPPVSES